MGDDQGAWPREPSLSTKLPDVVRTAFALEALLKAGNDVDALLVEQGIRWLLKVQNKSDDDGGWSFRCGIANSDVLPTCLALLALIQAKWSTNSGSRLGMEIRNSIENGLKTLVGKLREDCAAGKSPSFGKGLLEPAHTLYAILAFQAARHCGIGNEEYSEVENKALEWLAEQSGHVLQPIQEHIPIDTDRIKHQWDYDFQHMTDSLLYKVLHDSDHISLNKDSSLASDALISMGKRWDQKEGGFYGNCLFSWSTAKAICALSVCDDGNVFPPKPKPKPKPDGLIEKLKALLALHSPKSGEKCKKEALFGVI